MTKPSNISGIETATNRSWDSWVTLLERAGARALDHTAIAKLVQAELDGQIESAGWWAQGVTVAYEQHIGRRAPGQQNDGSFETSVTKTLDGSKDDMFALWNDAHGAVTEFNGQPVDNVRTSITPVRSYWRCDFTDGSRLAVAVEAKGADKAMVAITHTKLNTQAAKDDWQAFWKRQLEAL